MTRSFRFLRRATLAVLVAAPLALAACAGDQGDGGPVQQAIDPIPASGAAPDGPAEPRMEDGVQVVEIVAGDMGFQPRQITFRAGVPARLVVTRRVEDDCSSRLTVPAYDVDTGLLPLGEPVTVEFTPAEAGEIEFVCGMDMQRGTIAVVS